MIFSDLPKYFNAYFTENQIIILIYNELLCSEKPNKSYSESAVSSYLGGSGELPFSFDSCSCSF